jgi:hypothetical protein
MMGGGVGIGFVGGGSGEGLGIGSGGDGGSGRGSGDGGCGIEVIGTSVMGDLYKAITPSGWSTTAHATSVRAQTLKHELSGVHLLTVLAGPVQPGSPGGRHDS